MILSKNDLQQQGAPGLQSAPSGIGIFTVPLFGMTFGVWVLVTGVGLPMGSSSTGMRVRRSCKGWGGSHQLLPLAFAGFGRFPVSRPSFDVPLLGFPPTMTLPLAWMV